MKPIDDIAHLAKSRVQIGQRLSVLRAFVNPTRAEAGCVEYHLHISDNDPNLFFCYENWRTRKDLDEHLEMPYLKSFFERRMDLLEKEIDLQFMTMGSAYDK